MPDPTFLDVLKPYLKYANPGEEIDLDCPLTQLGIDSLTVVDLLIKIEDTFGIVFPDEYLTVETFRTARSLWLALDTVKTGVEAG